MHNPAIFAYGLKTRRSTMEINSALAYSTPLMIPANLLSSRTKAVIVNVIFKTCSDNVKNFRALQGNGVTTTTTLDCHLYSAWVIRLNMVHAMEPMLCKFIVDPSTFALTSARVAHYVFDQTWVSDEAFATSQQHETGS